MTKGLQRLEGCDRVRLFTGDETGLRSHCWDGHVNLCTC